MARVLIFQWASVLWRKICKVTNEFKLASEEALFTNIHKEKFMKCFNHPNVDAVMNCAYSNKPYCKDCLVEIEGKMYGKENLNYVMKELNEKKSNNQSDGGGFFSKFTTVDWILTLITGGLWLLVVALRKK